MKVSVKFWITLIFVCLTGILLAMIDTSKNWDDTGITVFAILISSFVCGLVFSKYAWLWAIIIGGSVFTANVIMSGNFGSFGALLFSFAGSYSGYFALKIFSGFSEK